MFKNIDLGLIFLRIGLGVMLLMHGIAKIINGISGVKTLLAKAGLFENLAYLVYVGEVLAPIMIILGLFTRFASFIVLVNCGFILYLFYGFNLFSLTSSGGFKAEIVYLYIFICLCLLLCGGGRYALNRS